MTHVQITRTPIADQLERDLRADWIQCDPRSFADARSDLDILRTASLAHDEINEERDKVIDQIATELGIELSDSVDVTEWATFDEAPIDRRAQLVKIYRFIFAILALAVLAGVCIVYATHPELR